MSQASDQSRQQAVFDRLRRGILAGTLPPGSRLPPTRHLADELAVARQTVVLAYERLAAEGYVRARIGSGTFVAAGIALAPRARLALVAPSHATPLGGALPIGRRLALLDWAARADAWLLEDDCDSEFRWEGKPLPPLASLDRAGRVIYCGTFSKTLAPALRLGFAVLPPPLTGAFVRARTLMDRGPGTLHQAVMAEFMRQGRLAPHIRRMRTEYARRRQAVLAALASHCPRIVPIAAPGGMHLVGRLPDDADEAGVVRAARARGLAVSPLAAYFGGTPRMRGLAMGFATTPIALAADTARRLAAAVRAAGA